MRRGIKRLIDLSLLVAATPFVVVPFVACAAAVRATSAGPVLHVSRRVGRGNRPFAMYKFRTMRIETPDVATHLLRDPAAYLTPVGAVLRRTSLDELPQLWNILKGDMSFVGPRPALHNQDDLVELRTRLGVHELVPGLTGWAQVNGRDDLPIPRKVELDAEYMTRQSIGMDVQILVLTAVKALRGEGVRH